MTDGLPPDLVPDRTRQYRQGAGAAAEDLRWSELRSRIRRFVAGRIGSQWADDVTGDILLKLLNSRDQLGRAHNPHAWVYRVAANAVADHFRRRKLESRAVELAKAEVDPAPASGDAGDSQAARRAIAACLRPFTLDLPPGYAEAIVLTSFEGLSQSEAARRVGLSVSGMKSRVRRARDELRRRLLDCCEFQRDRRGRVIAMQPHSQSR